MRTDDFLMNVKFSTNSLRFDYLSFKLISLRNNFPPTNADNVSLLNAIDVVNPKSQENQSEIQVETELA